MIIDIHGHISPPDMVKKYPMPPSLADIDGMVDRKAEAGIDLTIVGSPVGAGAMMRVPGVDNYGQTVDQLRAFHEWLSKTCAEHAGRLKAYVYTNPLGGDDLLEEAAETLKDDAFVGLIVNTSVDGEYLDSDRADAFFALAAQLAVPVMLHPPAEPVGSTAVRDFRLVEQVGRFGDVTMGLAAIVFAGWLEKYPTLQLIAATGGGSIALLPDKLDLAYEPRHWGGPPAPGGPPAGQPPAGVRPPMFENRISTRPSELLRRVAVDTAAPSTVGLQANIDTFGVGQVLFGTDSPPLTAPLETTIERVRQLELPQGQTHQILAGNAQRLFGLAPTS